MISNYYILRQEERINYSIRRVDSYTELFEDRIVFLGIPIGGDIANAAMAQLLCLQSTDTERQISIYINSPGGSFTALTVIYDTMRYIKSDIQTVCPRQAVSVITLLPAAGIKGKRLVLPSSCILVRQPATEGGYGQNSDLGIQAKKIMCIRELMENMFAVDTGQVVTKVSRDIEHDKHLTAQEAVEYGIVDNIPTFLKDVGARTLGPARVLRHGMIP